MRCATTKIIHTCLKKGNPCQILTTLLVRNLVSLLVCREVWKDGDMIKSSKSETFNLDAISLRLSVDSGLLLGLGVFVDSNLLLSLGVFADSSLLLGLGTLADSNCCWVLHVVICFFFGGVGVGGTSDGECFNFLFSCWFELCWWCAQ